MSFGDWQEAVLIVLWPILYHGMNLIAAFGVFIGFVFPLASAIKIMRRRITGK